MEIRFTGNDIIDILLEKARSSGLFPDGPRIEVTLGLNEESADAFAEVWAVARVYDPNRPPLESVTTPEDPS